ncbi:MAG: glycosyltransferase [Candidatus Brocadia sp. AMX3]|nr:glycosyltransferase [Candidatus Brocadia sp. AMX3]
MYRYSTENILSYPVTTGSKEDCIARIIQWVGTGAKGKYFVCANPHSLEMAKKDMIFEEAIKKADLITPDGVGIVIASKLLGGCIRERITGSDIFLEVSAVLNKESNYTYFFLGSTEKNLQTIKDKMKVDFPNIKVAGAYSPPFKPEFTTEENRIMVETINRAKPDVLWVGMTAPKQEKWIYKHKDQLEVKFIGAIGAVFDFYTGNVKRSHPIFQNFGLEWLPRLMREPGRLWRRNFISNPSFLLRAIRSGFHNKLRQD